MWSSGFLDNERFPAKSCLKRTSHRYFLIRWEMEWDNLYCSFLWEDFRKNTRKNVLKRIVLYNIHIQMHLPWFSIAYMYYSPFIPGHLVHCIFLHLPPRRWLKDLYEEALFKKHTCLSDTSLWEVAIMSRQQAIHRNHLCWTVLSVPLLHNYSTIGRGF